MKLFVDIAVAFCMGAGDLWAETSVSDDGAHVPALDNSWNRALETNDTKALDVPQVCHTPRAFSRYLGQSERHVEMRHLRRGADPISVIRLPVLA